MQTFDHVPCIEIGCKVLHNLMHNLRAFKHSPQHARINLELKDISKKLREIRSKVRAMLLMLPLNFNEGYTYNNIVVNLMIFAQILRLKLL